MTHFTETRLKHAILSLTEQQGYPHHKGDSFPRPASEKLIKEAPRDYPASRYASVQITDEEIDSVLRKPERLPTLDLVDSNRESLTPRYGSCVTAPCTTPSRQRRIPEGSAVAEYAGVVG